MTTLNNEIEINASAEKIFQLLAEMEALENLDPNVKKSTALTNFYSGMNAARKVDMIDGKNWFQEKVTDYKPYESLTYELTACSFPVKSLKYTYTIEKSGNQTKVKQAMTYEIKFGLFGKILDALLIRKQYKKGIQSFFNGLKSFAESH